MPPIRFIFILGVVASLSTFGYGSVKKELKADFLGFKKIISPIFQKNCINCHGPKKVKGKFRVDQLDPDLLHGENISEWLEVYDVISNSEMPPEDEPDYHLNDSLRTHFVDWLGQEIQKATLFRKDKVKHSSFRRLANYEYNAVLQDLLGLPYQFTQDLPPEADSEHGFTNSSELLQISSMQLELYREIAKKALNKAIVIGPRPKVQNYQITMTELFHKAIEMKQKAIDDLKVNERVKRSPYLINQETGKAYYYQWHYNKADWHFKPVQKKNKTPKPGKTVAVLTPQKELKIDLGNTIPDRGRMRVRIRVGKDKSHANITSGLRLTFGSRMSNEGNISKLVNASDLVVSANVHSPSFIEYSFPLAEMHRNLFRKTKKLGEYPNPSEYLAIKHIANPHGRREGVKLHIDYIEIEAGVFEHWPPKSHTSIFLNSTHKKNEERYSQQVLKQFIEKAWRRPVSDKEIEIYKKYFLKIRPKFPSFEEAMIEVLVTVLSSPEFLYINQNLVNRLSFFLWSSMPDAELMTLQNKGRLSDPKVLKTQIDRMLQDSRSSRFKRNFVKGWLHLEGLNSVSVDKDKFKIFYQDRFKQDVAQEPYQFFNEVLKKNHSIMDFIHSDYLMINSRLARHYRIHGVQGSNFRRVKINPMKNNRGGLLTSAAVMTMNSDGVDSSPLSRGVWLLESILNDPPPPPPANVPEVDLTDPRILKMTQKERMEDHRNNAACKSCHVKIDPWGIAFENYDAIGQFRTQLGNKPVDASTFINGKHKVNNANALKQYLLTHKKEAFAQALVHKVSSYALGRPLSFSDRYELEKMASQLKKKGYGMKDLIYIVCQSDLFKMNQIGGKKHE